MSNTIYLYLKTHNQTGLKYLGKTERNPFKYKGSGVYWRRHLKKYGSDVTTEVLFQTEDPEELQRIGIEYSSKWDVVNSNEFANLIEENGVGGDTSSHRKYGKMSTDSKKKLSESKKGTEPWNKGKKGIKRGPNKKPMSEETKRKISETLKQRKLRRN